MIQHLRSRLRIAVVATICALVAAPALVTGTASPAAAAPPGLATSTLTVNGQGLGGPWQLDSGAYDELKSVLTDLDNFGPNGVFKKGSFVIPATPITTDLSFPGTLSALDVFFAGMPNNGGYSNEEITALQAFNADGRALVLNSNDIGFGEVATFLGFEMRTERAFFGTDTVCGWTNNGAAGSESATSNSNAMGSHAIHSGPFGTAPTVSNYHTVQVFTSLPAEAQGLYNLAISGQQSQLALTGPIGHTTAPGVPDPTHVSYQAAVVTGSTTITTAALTPSGIASVAFYHTAAGVEDNLIGTDDIYPYEVTWDTAAAAPLGVDDGIHAVIARVTRTGGGTFDATLQYGINVDNVEPAPDDPDTAHIHLDCPGAQDVVDNNISGPTVAVIPAKALSANSGPIIVTTDLDSMSNAFDTSWDQNRTFALNAFAWIMDNIIPDIPDDTYFPLPNPERVYDSRSTTSLAHHETRDIPVAGLKGVPTDAGAVIANVTVVDPDGSGYFTVFPTGATRPDTSTHNFGAGENFANMIVMQVGDNRSISVFDYLYSETGSVDVLVDIIGYTRRDNAGTRLHTMAPGRVLDTREGIGLPKAPFGVVTKHLTVRGGTTGVPSDAESVVLNMTVTNATDPASFVTVWPMGSPQPDVSNLNNVMGVARPNLVVARVGSNNQVSIANAFGTADIIADVVGYFRAGAYKSGGLITGLTPDRILNTRPNDAFDQGEVRSIQVAGRGGIPANAKTAILKVTAVDPTNDGFLTVWPSGPSPLPNVSNLNFGPHMTIPNLVIIQLGTTGPDAGKINIYNAFGTTNVLVDVLGYAD